MRVSAFCDVFEVELNKNTVSCKQKNTVSCKQQNSYSISHLLDTVTTQWLDSDSVVTIANCRQHGASGSEAQ